MSLIGGAGLLILCSLVTRAIGDVEDAGSAAPYLRGASVMADIVALIVLCTAL